MPILNGFELLDNLSFRDFFLIFTTAHSQYGLRALKQNAIDYLLKPIGKNSICQAIERVEKRIQENKPQDTQKILNELLTNRNLKIPLATKKVLNMFRQMKLSILRPMLIRVLYCL